MGSKMSRPPLISLLVLVLLQMAVSLTLFSIGGVPRHIPRRRIAAARSDNELWLRDPYLWKQASTVAEDIDGIVAAARGIRAWRRALAEGRLPDLERESAWPTYSGLREAYVEVLEDLDLLRFTGRYPILANVAVDALVAMVVNGERGDRVNTETEETDIGDEARAVLETLRQNIAAPVSGVGTLDALLGDGHGLLMDTKYDSSNRRNQLQKQYGLEDGIWHHSGWKAIPPLQEKLRDMRELKSLVDKLGRRPALRGKRRRLPPTVRVPDSYTDIPKIAVVAPDRPGGLEGLTRGGDVARVLPTDLALLKAKGGSNTSKTLRTLFLARLAERQLLSFEMQDFVEERAIVEPLDAADSRSKRRKRKMERRPSGRGGPIIICLDTSWSMAGAREDLAKAVVLECVRGAFKQHRRCFVAAFSGASNLEECEVTIGKFPGKARKQLQYQGHVEDAAGGLEHLLDFLASSFRGGTDAIRPLKWAIEQLKVADGSNQAGSGGGWSDADVCIVTDGELRMPPVDEAVLKSLRRLQNTQGVEVHGLLVGRPESPPLELICSPGCVHTFLSRHDPLTVMKRLSEEQRTEALMLEESAPASSSLGGDRLTSQQLRCRRLHATVPQQRSRSLLRRTSTIRFAAATEQEESWGTGTAMTTTTIASGVAELAQHINRAADATIRESRGEDLDSLAHGDVVTGRSQWPAGHPAPALCTALRALEEGLVERETECRLLLLATLAKQHLLLLGPPGVAKSLLAKRLANIMEPSPISNEPGGGRYFERTLTRFTTPEELFGPLSLRALERNDTYERRVEGFLPDAEVAFLDEIFKANSAILNTMLSILNERAFDQGAHRIKCPLRTAVAASNEIPDSDETDALFDRFLLRRIVKPVSDENLGLLLGLTVREGDFKLPSSPDFSGPMSSTQTNLKEAVKFVEDKATATKEGGDNVVGYVEVPGFLVTLFTDLRRYLREELAPGDMSDRRIVAALQLLKVSAAANGRSIVGPSDCLLLEHVAWEDPSDAPVVKEWLLSAIPAALVASAAPARFLVEGLWRRAVDIAEECAKDMAGTVTTLNMRSGERLEQELQTLVDEVAAVECVLQNETRELRLSTSDMLPDNPDNIFLSSSDAILAKQRMGKPILETNLPEIEEIQRQSHVLKFALLSVLGRLDSDTSESAVPCKLMCSELPNLLSELYGGSIAPTTRGKIKESIANGNLATPHVSKAPVSLAANAAFGDKSRHFSAEELSLSKKVAKATFKDAEELRAWKLAKKRNRSTKKKTEDDEDEDDSYR